MMTTIDWLKPLVLLGLFVSGPQLAAAAEPAGVVYHVDSSDRAVMAMRNITNHRKIYPELPIIVVALADGVRFLLDGTRDARGNSYAAMVEPLAMDGVIFKACGNTLNANSLDADDLSFGVEVVTSGVAEIGRLQLEEGYAYIKP
jgi:intracellular sulfur oxidation DsrE/DsrF family protein